MNFRFFSMGILFLTGPALFGASLPEQWRQQKRTIDLHQHIGEKPEYIQRAVKILDASGVGIGVNLSGGVTTPGPDGKSEFQKNKELFDQVAPNHFVYYMNLDYDHWNDPDFSAQAVKQVEEGRRLGAAGLKEYKRLGLYLKDKEGHLLKIDDPKLDPVWEKCGELGMPVSIHVGDPKAFWLPYDEKNERWTELKDHKSWWFGDPSQFPPREELIEALNRVIGKHPKTTFVCVHFANNPEDVDWVARSLEAHPNMNADLAARVPELGRQDPKKLHDLFVKYQDRIFFATDFMVYDKLTLGSGGSGPPPSDEVGVEFYRKHWRWMETWDKNFEHMTPIQGDWKISGIGLPNEVLRKIYFDNAHRLLARSLPLPVIRAQRIAEPFHLDGHLNEKAWLKASPQPVDYNSHDSSLANETSRMEVRVLWNDAHLFISFKAPFSKLTVFENGSRDKERIGLWERDVVEAFICPDSSKIKTYLEFESAPNGEKLDLKLPEKDFGWESHFKTAENIDPAKKIWTTEWDIPMEAFGKTPKAGERWRINFYRMDKDGKAGLAWNPALTGTFHTPERFGWMEFVE